MLWRANYITDAGKSYFFISLEISDFFLPQVLIDNAIRGFGFCSLPRSISPRRVIFWDTEGNEHIIEYPFRPATPEWIEFWREIKASSLIVASQGMGEVIRGLK